MIKKMLIGLGVLIGSLLIIAAFKPSETITTRELVISASPDILFPYINNAKKSYEWMPWADGDPTIEIKFSGPDEGVGSLSSWNGKKMGLGTSEVIESVPNQKVRTKLVYKKPFEMSQIAEITLSPSQGGTLVKWSVYGKAKFFFRVVGIFVDCDKMIGDQFLKGLNTLKQLVENK